MFDCAVDAPPPWYDHGPAVYDVQYVTREWLQRHTGRFDLDFCGWVDISKNPPQVFVITDTSKADQAKVLRHELGHVRGWRHRDSGLASLLKKLKAESSK